MQVLIIAGGLGTRLGQLTLNQPKSMIQTLVGQSFNINLISPTSTRLVLRKNYRNLSF